MGGRGASSGTSIKGEKYGTEYHAVKKEWFCIGYRECKIHQTK